jgi:tetratricopeptide (TPR) repeat protein
MKILKELTREYLQLSDLSHQQSLSDEFIFQKIAELDEKYKNVKPHYESFEGLLSNIGTDQKSIKVLNCVIKRLSTKKTELPPNKYYYDLANTILAKADIEFTTPSDLNYLINSTRYKEAKNTFILVEKDDPSHFERATTNIANILEKYGRNYEALYAYERAIKFNPNFGMALGNKAIALEYYIRLAPQQSLVLLNQSYLLLKHALKDEKITEIGGPCVAKVFENKLTAIESYFKKILYTPKGVQPPKNITKYQQFILDNNLFLNYDFGYFYDKESLKDNFFPNLSEEINSNKSAKTSIMSEKTYFCFQVFNQTMEDFITSRYNFYKAINLRCKKIDKNTNYIYTYDYTGHSLKFGMLKSVFSSLYNCLDKTAHLVNYYFSKSEIDANNINIYFDWFTSDEFREIIIQKQNYRLLALFSLALDFKPNSPFNNLQTIRNRITHSFLNVAMDFSLSKEPESYEISEELLIEHIHSLFVVVKSAIIYTIIAIRLDNTENNTLPMMATMQSDIY